MRRVDKTRVGKHCCSVECRTFRQLGTLAASTYERDDVIDGRAVGTEWVVGHARVFAAEVAVPGVALEDIGPVDILHNLASGSLGPALGVSVPVSKGGEHSMRNVRSACLACTCSKARQGST